MEDYKKTVDKTLKIINPMSDARESVSTTLSLMISAFTLVSALAWNEAIKGVFTKLQEEPTLQSLGAFAPFVYAILVTLLTVYLTNRIKKINEKFEKDKDKKITKK